VARWSGWVGRHMRAATMRGHEEAVGVKEGRGAGCGYVFVCG
jgi:hypothetical protein